MQPKISKDIIIGGLIGIGILFLLSGISPLISDYFLQNDKEIIITNRNSTIMKVTGYCSCKICCGKYADGITASGYKLRKGNKLCAANFPFCTVLKIPGYGIAPVLDRGGAIKEGCIDVYFDTHQEALDWGVRYLKVRILK